MENTGKALEQIVKLIEENLLNSDFSITTREKIFDDRGNQIAEFDVVIEGKVGSIPIKILIECRDRPSQGTAPKEWIEQLYGRKMFHNFNQVLAVSSTDFSPAAKTFAKDFNIELRSLDKVTSESIGHWLKAIFVLKHASFNKAIITPVNNKIYDECVAFIESKNKDSKIFYLQGSENAGPLNLQEIWISVVKDNPQLFDGLVANGSHRHLEVITMFNEYKGKLLDPFKGFKKGENTDPKIILINKLDMMKKLYLSINGRLEQILYILFTCKIFITSEQKEPIDVYFYSDEDKIISSAFWFVFEGNENPLIITIN